MSCAGCVRCEDGPMVTLVTGATVCTWCEDWRAETEARTVLAMPQPQRRPYLYGAFENGRLVKRGIEQVRGKPAADALAALVRVVWAHNRAS